MLLWDAGYKSCLAATVVPVVPYTDFNIRQQVTAA